MAHCDPPILPSFSAERFGHSEKDAYLCNMNRSKQEYIDILRSHADILRTKYGISYMRLFGSVARNEHRGDSDVDLFVIMPPKALLLCAAADYLESILGTNVDLIRKHSNMRPFFVNQIEKYGIDIFGQA